MFEDVYTLYSGLFVYTFVTRIYLTRQKLWQKSKRTGAFGYLV